METPDVITQFVSAASAADRDGAAACVTEDAVFELPGGRSLPSGRDGARAFAAQHAESEGRKPTVELHNAGRREGDLWLASLHFVSREVATGETLYEMDVGGIFALRGGLIARLRAFPSAAEAEQALTEG
jgi:ketosteroid isomerase-like protein